LSAEGMVTNFVICAEIAPCFSNKIADPGYCSIQNLFSAP
jgi:hypothetical protein